MMRATFLTLSTDSNLPFHEDTSQIHPRIVFYQLSGHHQAQRNLHKMLSTASVNKEHSLIIGKQPFHFFSHSHCIDLYDV